MSKNSNVLRKRYDKLSILYFKLTNNSITKPRSTGGLGVNFQNKKIYTVVTIILIILFIIVAIIYLTQ